MSRLTPVPEPEDNDVLGDDGILGAETCPSCRTVTDGRSCYYCDRDAQRSRNRWRDQQ